MPTSRWNPWTSPIWDRNLYVSSCIEVLDTDQHRTEAIIVVRIAIGIIEREHTCIRTIAIITTAFEERIASVRKVRVVTV